MVKSILVGLLLTMATVGIHAIGTERLIRRLRKTSAIDPFSLDSFTALSLLCSTAVYLLMLHVLEVALWALAYLVILDIDQLDSIEEATYFSMVTLTTLGYGDIVIQGPWRLLSGIQAMTGLLVFGWSTALLFALVRALWIVEEQ